VATPARTPVIIGVGQAEQRVDDPAAALEPIDLLHRAVDAALDDSGASSRLLPLIDTIGVVQIVSWNYPDPGALVARRLGADAVRRTVMTTVGGNSPQMLMNVLAAEIASGATDVAVLGGSECMSSRWRSRREPKVWLDWAQPDDPPCREVVGDDRPGSSPYELEHLASAPVHVYPLLETALRAAAHEGVQEHQERVSVLWADFAAVAANNPHAWSREGYSAEEIRGVGQENRMVTFPYPKRMCANMGVDQAAALVMCSYDAARTAGIADDRLVFPLAGADAHDQWFFSERDRLDASPAIRVAANAALDAAGLGIDDVARFDLYSCFPAAVEIAMGALDLGGPAAGDDRPLTVTGGLGFAGGPVNNYPTHAIAAMVDACRRDPGTVGYVGALGWYSTKHSIGLYSTDPPTVGFQRVDPAVTQVNVDALGSRKVAGPYAGPAEVEATAVVYDRDGGPSVAIVSALTPDGRRALANSTDADTMVAMTVDGIEGTAVELSTDGTTNRL
jgi:acetyl-CoA C-acetyltransferase